ncbi:hypothetical protein PGH07_02975 [Sulfurovum sp. zt1-1]|uniref:DUF4304 domain-containing protein n=1 Tax=Sulfurovum zhangzhouensis TaxID=3019067 RepID=A0ABT7QWA4_9BACT|nr:hypothetical protein [Sulfurovum zhangzhouensis]MDM5271128.1 hypothetical protein [Sulfurovum zhangzhouensis]
MSLFYKASNKELANLRKEVFLKRGMPTLEKKGFVKSPFQGAFFGSFPFGYMYEFCRIDKNSLLIYFTVTIVRGDKYIQLHLNIFKLQPEIHSVEELKGIDGIQYQLPPNNRTKIRLSPPKGLIFYKMPQEKIKTYYTKSGLDKRIEELGDILEKNLTNIDTFIERWLHEHQPMLTAWNGMPQKTKTL